MSSKIDSGQKPSPEPDKNFYYAVQPNQMTYVDDTGVSRCIHIPRGKNQEACERFKNEDWKALSLFPEWTGAPEQQYSDKNYIKMPKQQAGAG
ncbi:hypothetical protein Q7P35_001502 [Cladosporium inversicolor]